MPILGADGRVLHGRAVGTSTKTLAETNDERDQEAQAFLEKLMTSGLDDLGKFLSVLRYAKEHLERGLKRSELMEMGIEVDHVALTSLEKAGLIIKKQGHDRFWEYYATEKGMKYTMQEVDTGCLNS